MTTNADIDKRLDKIESRQTEFRESVDSIMVNQSDQINKINKIHFLLAGAGSEYKNGGMCADFKEIKKKVRKNTLWRISITAAGTAVLGLISFIFTKLAK